MYKLSLLIFTLFMTNLSMAECLRNTEEELLSCYYDALISKDEKAVLELYWGIKNFNVGNGLKLKDFKVIEKHTLKKDKTELFKNMLIDKVPLWAREGTTETIVVQYLENGEEQKIYYSIREIESKLYIVGHSAFDAPI
jgi:hypothetical protein